MNIIGISCILLLVMLFLKVPVYISVLAASAIYFLGNPATNATIFAQQTLARRTGSVPAGDPVLRHGGRIHELYGRYAPHHGLLRRSDRAHARRSGAG